MSTGEKNPENLSKLFQEGLNLYNLIDKTDEATNSSEVQAEIKRAIGVFENVTRLASLTGLFSTNESIDEVATNDLQFLMLPALLGTLSLKITSRERNDIIECAAIYFKDFLQRTNEYGLSDYTFKDTLIPTTSTNSQNVKTNFEQLKDMVHTRQTKIHRYKEQKGLQMNLDKLKRNMSNLNVDDEIKRNYLLTMIKIFIYKSIDEIASIEMERPLLVYFDDKGEDSSSSSRMPKKEAPKPKPLRPVIITKDDVQKAVFGAGYPSLPTFTVKEFYDQRVKDGVFPDPSKPSTGLMSLQEQALAGLKIDDDEEDVANEKNIEEDDPETLQRLRNKDDYKDDHRRGWGNRMNRS